MLRTEPAFMKCNKMNSCKNILKYICSYETSYEDYIKNVKDLFMIIRQ